MAPEDIVEEINAGSKDKQWGKYCFAILDVMTTNALPYDDVLYVPRCRRVDDLPFSSDTPFPGPFPLLSPSDREAERTRSLHS